MVVKASLVLVKPDGSTREIAVSAEKRVIGRSDDCNVRIPVAEVSRHHCELRLDEDADAIVVRDLESSNGTFVNGQRIHEKELTPGDLLAVGPAVFVVRMDGFPAEIDAADSYRRGRPRVDADGTASPAPKRQKDPEGSSFFDDFDFSTDDEEEERL